jgi:endonuclease-3
MKKSEKAKFIQSILDERYPDPGIPLNHYSPYTLLIAVLLSAQCTDDRVNLVTPELFRKADTPQKMVKLSYEEILELIRSCGLAPTKAKAILKLSHILLDKYKGEVPKTFSELEELPGVGHKTASVVMSQAFHEPAFPVDTHIFRSAIRWGLSKGKSVEQVEEDLKKIFPRTTWNKLHLQIIHFARAHCPARNHHPDNCPICKVLTCARKKSS